VAVVTVPVPDDRTTAPYPDPEYITTYEDALTALEIQRQRLARAEQALVAVNAALHASGVSFRASQEDSNG